MRNEDRVPSWERRIAVYVRVVASLNYRAGLDSFYQNGLSDSGPAMRKLAAAFRTDAKRLFSRLEAFMKATIDELNCEGTILIDSIERGLVTCWLTKEQTGVEGTIVGEEAMMIEIQAAGKASLRLRDGSILPIRSCGGSNGIRWVKVLSP
jgi:hypothetical protein